MCVKLSTREVRAGAVAGVGAGKIVIRSYWSDKSYYCQTVPADCLRTDLSALFSSNREFRTSRLDALETPFRSMPASR